MRGFYSEVSKQSVEPSKGQHHNHHHVVIMNEDEDFHYDKQKELKLQMYAHKFKDDEFSNIKPELPDLDAKREDLVEYLAGKGIHKLTNIETKRKIHLDKPAGRVIYNQGNLNRYVRNKHPDFFVF